MVHDAWAAAQPHCSAAAAAVAAAVAAAAAAVAAAVAAAAAVALHEEAHVRVDLLAQEAATALNVPAPLCPAAAAAVAVMRRM